MDEDFRKRLKSTLESERRRNDEEIVLLQTVKLEIEHCSVNDADEDAVNRHKILTIIRRNPSNNYYLLGVDVIDDDDEARITLGLVSRLFWDTQINLNGDGGFTVKRQDFERPLMFKPVSVQALWTVLQTLDLIVRTKLSPTAANNQDDGEIGCGGGFEVNKVEKSPEFCVNEWLALDEDLEHHNKTSGVQDEVNAEIKRRLRIIMKRLDLDSMTSKAIRSQLEREMETNLQQRKSFIDAEILVVLGQMDSASEILDEFLYLGSEWNASNLEELRQNGITHVLNVTREIDNFFPAVFQYLNIREYDVESTDLLKHFDRVFRFIKGVRKVKGRVLVHCKMGISRSATCVIAYCMKEHNWDLKQALNEVKTRRKIVKPNKGFVKQLEVYEGMLNAVRNYGTLYRSKSENCLNEESSAASPHPNKEEGYKSCPPVNLSVDIKALSSLFLRPKSWSPDEELARVLMPPPPPKGECTCEDSASAICTHCDNMELELCVPEAPVKIMGHDDDQDEDSLVRSIANLPIQVRHSLPINAHRIRSSVADDEDGDPDSKSELNVKTLASMFDFKLNHERHSNSTVDRLEDCAIFQKAAKQCEND